MSKGLGAAYAKKWRDAHPSIRDRYNRSVEGRYSQLKRAVKRGGFASDISLEDYRQIIDSGECFYCAGALPSFGYGLDRLDNRLGYTKHNVVPCCGGNRKTSCNYRKGHLECAGFTYPRSVELLREIVRNDGRETNNTNTQERS